MLAGSDSGIDGDADDTEGAVASHEDSEARDIPDLMVRLVVVDGNVRLLLRLYISSALVFCPKSKPDPGLVSTDEVDGDGDVLDKSNMTGEDETPVTRTPGCFGVCFCARLGVLLDVVPVLVVLMLRLILRAEEDRR